MVRIVDLGEPAEDERIVSAACFYKGAIISVSCPARHRDVLDAAIAMGLDPNAVGYHQGFATSTGRFVLRDEALAIAKRADQFVRKPDSASNLFSEDVW